MPKRQPAGTERVTSLKLTGRQVMKARANMARKANYLLNRLYHNAMGELKTRVLNQNGEWEEVPIEMTSGQIASARICLAKIIPDLQNMEIKQPNDSDELSKEELMARLRALLISNPEFRTLLPALLEGPNKALEGELIKAGE